MASHARRKIWISSSIQPSIRWLRRLVPDWHDRLAHVDASLDRLERFAFSQAADPLQALQPLRLRCRAIV
jgi:hypothetical protein